MKRLVLALLLGATTIGGLGTLVSAETTPPPKPAPAAPAPSPGAHGGHGMMGPDMMGGGMMGMCPMASAAGTKVEVKKIDKGVTITYTSSDPATVTRLQKMAEAMRLMHEANSP
jgi:hypothetical protein